MSYLERIAEHCRTKEFACPEDFIVRDVILRGSNSTVFLVKGAAYPEIKKGERKGKPNWKKPVEGTYREYFLFYDEVFGALSND